MEVWVDFIMSWGFIGEIIGKIEVGIWRVLDDQQSGACDGLSRVPCTICWWSGGGSLGGVSG